MDQGHGGAQRLRKRRLRIHGPPTRSDHRHASGGRAGQCGSGGHAHPPGDSSEPGARRLHLAAEPAEAAGDCFADAFQGGAHLSAAALAAKRTLTRFSTMDQVPCNRLVDVLRFGYRSDSSMTMNETATLSSKFQISIPKAIRTAQHWEAGLTFAFIPKGTGVLLIPVPKKHDLKGLAKGARPDDYRDRSDRVW
jgi:bifunctional DNA-binding transcriptional regulator/antitoxin component of YhaV-PrlF toxin-antitoxin module